MGYGIKDQRRGAVTRYTTRAQDKDKRQVFGIKADRST
jgi:hypothetical protein